MKKHMLFLTGLIAANVLLAQVPQGISNQAVIRNANNELVTNSTIGLQVSIIQGSVDGDVVYAETHMPVSNALGMITYIIGEGYVAEGHFAEIDWSAGPYFLKTEADPNGGTDYSIIGTVQFFSVPYALFAESFYGIEGLLSRIEALEEALDIGDSDGTVTDIDGNVYQTVIIDGIEWMKENLRVTRYNNEDDILTGLNNTEWSTTTNGAYAIYNNNDDMLEAYGILYNWFALSDARGLCPGGWSLPSDADWTNLVNYLVSLGFPNDWNNPNGAGNALKSCRQVNSPLGNDCDTSQHPRWDEDLWSGYNHNGFDEFGFSALPGGYRTTDGNFFNLGPIGYWWSSSEHSPANAWHRSMNSYFGDVYRGNYGKRAGFNVRCFREVYN